MSLLEILQSLSFEGESAYATIPDTWLQGRSAYGGLQAALVVQAMRQQVPLDVPLRTLQTVFVAPVPAGRMRIETRVLRQGKSATQIEGRLYDGEQLACLCIAVFGRGRESKIVVALKPEAPPKSPEDSFKFPYMPGLMPTFTQHVDFRWATSALPFSGSATPRLQVHVRLMQPAAAGAIADDVLLVALADAPPSPAMAMYKGPVAGSSLTWSLDVLDETPRLAPEEFLYIDNQASAGHNGYVSQTATLSAADGRPLALSRQMFVIFG